MLTTRQICTQKILSTLIHEQSNPSLQTFTTTEEWKKQGKMSANKEWVSWYEKPQKQQSADTGEQKSSLGADEKDASITDPGNVDVQAGVFNKVANTFTQLFSNKQCHLTRSQTKTKIGWTTTGELGVLRQEQDAQYEFMEELEQKIKDLNKEVGVLKDLVKAYEAKMEHDNDLLQHCMHWITMVQVFGDVPVARDRMRWKPGRDAALVGGSEDGSEDGNENEDEGDEETTI